MSACDRGELTGLNVKPELHESICTTKGSFMGPIDKQQYVAVALAQVPVMILSRCLTERQPA